MGEQRGRVLYTDGADAAMQMAIDEALARSVQDGPVLRLYRWCTPAISWGYFIEADPGVIGRPGWELVRRPTGGGLVEHGEDLTYTLILPRFTEAALSPAEAFAAANHLVLRALQAVGVPAVSSEEASSPQPLYCATQLVAGDALVGGQKVAGCAARRLRRAMLLQGYLDLPRLGAPVSWSRMAGAMQTAAAAQWPVAWRTDELAASEIALAGELAEHRYRTAAWNYPKKGRVVTA